MNPLPINLSDLYQPHKSVFGRYAALLIKWNQKINLTSIVEPKEIEELHFLDSLSIFALLPSPNVSRETSVLDIGAGAGFPGIPLKIIRPDIRLTLVDSIKKKCDFMKEVIRTLGLHGADVIHRRVTENSKVGEFDLVISRAAFKMREFILHAVPNLKKGGLLIGMKTAPRGTVLATSRPVLPEFDGRNHPLQSRSKVDGSGVNLSEDVMEEIRECESLLHARQLSQLKQFYYVLPITGQMRSLVVSQKC